MTEPVFAVFENLKSTHAETYRSDYGLEIKVGVVMGCPCIKVLKNGWSTIPHSVIRNNNGIFFSVWHDPKKPDLLKFNLHALKLRDAGYKIPAKKFAADFRDACRTKLASWPSLTMHKAPHTLFEGAMPYSAATVERDTTSLMNKFLKLAPVVDTLLIAA